MNTKILKWVAILSPAALVALIEYVRHIPQVLKVFPMSTTNWVAPGAALAVSYVYFQLVFTLLERAQGMVQRKQQELAILTERERIGRNLHDGICQTLFFANVKLMEAEKALSEGQLKTCETALSEGRAALRSIHEDVRRIIFDVRALKGCTGDFATMLKQYLVEFHKQTGLEVRLDDGALREFRLDPEGEASLLSIIQEALWNVRKHSGASVAELSFLAQGGSVEVRIRDNGCGFTVPGQGEMVGQAVVTGPNREPRFGLGLMKERAALLGANLSIKAAEGQGTEVVVSLPGA